MAKIKLNIKQDEQLSLVAHQLVHYADIVDIQNWDELLKCYFSIKKDVAAKKVFLVLDDRSQAEYTSMHAIGDERLYIDYSDDLKDIDVNDPKWELSYQNVCMPKQLQRYIQQLRRIENQCVIEELSKKMQHYDEDDLQALIYLNQDFAPSMDTEIVVKVAEIETESLKIAMMPNGYFTCDFDPFENFAIIQRMQHYGYEFIGLGAALLGWVKTEAFRAEKIENLMQDLSVIYPLDSAHQMALKTLILKNNYLILPYSESPQEYLGYDLS